MDAQNHLIVCPVQKLSLAAFACSVIQTGTVKNTGGEAVEETRAVNEADPAQTLRTAKATNSKLAWRTLQRTSEVESTMRPLSDKMWQELESFNPELESTHTNHSANSKGHAQKSDALRFVRTIQSAVDALQSQIGPVHALSKTNHTVLRATQEHISLRRHAQDLGLCCKLAQDYLRVQDLDGTGACASNLPLEHDSDADVENPPGQSFEHAPHQLKAKTALKKLSLHIETKLSDAIDLVLGKDLEPVLKSISKLQRDMDALKLGVNDAQPNGTTQLQLTGISCTSPIEMAIRSVNSEMIRQATTICDTQLYEASDVMPVVRKAIILALQATELWRARTWTVLGREPSKSKADELHGLEELFADGRRAFAECFRDAWVLAPLSQMMDLDDSLDRLLVSGAMDKSDQQCKSFEACVGVAKTTMQEHVAALHDLVEDGGVILAIKDSLALLCIAECTAKLISHGRLLLQARGHGDAVSRLKTSQAHIFEGFGQMLPEKHPLHRMFKNFMAIQESAWGLIDAAESTTPAVHEVRAGGAHGGGAWLCLGLGCCADDKNTQGPATGTDSEDEDCGFRGDDDGTGRHDNDHGTDAAPHLDEVLTDALSHLKSYLASTNALVKAPVQAPATTPAKAQVCTHLHLASYCLSVTCHTPAASMSNLSFFHSNHANTTIVSRRRRD